MKTDASMKSEIENKETYEARDELFAFLDIIRESGQINMFGAAPVLVETYGLSRRDARRVLLEWMDTFSRDTRKNPA